jgi:hypothetical protein
MKPVEQRNKKQKEISGNDLGTPAGETNVILNSLLRVLLIGMTLSAPIFGGAPDDLQDTWPCGELPKILRDQNGKPVWLSSTRLSKRIVNRVEPKVPSSIRLEGKIIADILIGSDGRVRCVRVRKGHPILRRAVEQAVNQWTFKPVFLKGEPVAVFGFLQFHFSN